MKILFLANRVPYPPHRGDKLKIYNLAKRLSKKHELVLLTFAEDKSELAYKSILESIFVEIHIIYLPKWKSWWSCARAIFQDIPFQIAYFRDKNMSQKLDILLEANTFDVIHTQHLRMSQYTHSIKNIPSILDLPDAYSLYWERRKNSKRPLLNRIFDSFESKRVIEYEKIVNEYDLNLICSVEDKNHMIKRHPAANFELLINGVDLDTFKHSGHNYSINNKLLFTGNMDYAPNVDAVVYFVKEMLPLIKKKYPNIEFIIAGQRPIPKVMALEQEGVRITGFVKNISKMYEEAAIVVAPLRFGAGTQNKVIEAMAMGVPVVCTDIGFEGLQVQQGEGVLHASNKEEFIAYIEELLCDEEKRTLIGNKGLKVAQERYSWDKVSSILEDNLENLIKLK